MQSVGYMFNDARDFNQDISNFILTSVTYNLHYMFQTADDQGTLDQTFCWNIPSDQTTTDMFAGQTSMTIDRIRSDCVQCGGGEYRVDPDTCEVSK